MLIMVAGPYTAETKEERRNNLSKINQAAVQVVKKGHIPVVGIHAALPIVESGNFADAYGEIMKISLALADRCDSILCLGSSKGVEMERSVFVKKGLPIYQSIQEIP